MKIKIIRHIETELDKDKGILVHKDLYDAYHGFTGLPQTFPFFTKWVLDRQDMDFSQMEMYVADYVSFNKATLIKC